MKISNCQFLISKHFLFLFLIVSAILTVAARLMPHLPNFTPVGAFALFVGAYLAPKYRWGIFLPVFLMFVSDLFIGFYDAKLMAVVYASFFAYSLLGIFFVKKKNPANIFLGSFGGALFFYLATNFAVWAFSNWYPHTIQGLLLSYTMALPFFRFTVLGDLFFSALFFGAYEFAVRFVPLLQVKSNRGIRNLVKL